MIPVALRPLSRLLKDQDGRSDNATYNVGHAVCYTQLLESIQGRDGVRGGVRGPPAAPAGRVMRMASSGRSRPAWPKALQAQSGADARQDSPASSLLPRPGAAQPAPGQIERALELLDHAWALFGADDRLVFCNEMYRSLLGPGAPDELVGLSHAHLLELWLDELQFSGEQERAEFRAQRLLQRCATRSDFEVLTRSGQCLRVTERRTPEGGVATTVLDRTQEQRSAAELRRALAASEAASAAKGDLLCSMSHELRTPLNAVLGFAQLLQRDSKEPLSARQQPRVAQILDGGDHLVHLIDGLLDLSRIEAGRLPVSLELVDLAEAFERVRATLEPLAVASGVHLRLSAPREVPPVVVDAALLAQILMNFGSNAIKYNRADGSVTFAARVLSPDCVRISVSDTGIGIPLDQRDRLFEPFQRAGQERGNIKGTGMGLAITKRLVALMHGTVGFSSIWTQGSEFWVDLPRCAPSAPGEL